MRKSSLKNAILLSVLWIVGLLVVDKFVVKDNAKFQVQYSAQVDRDGYEPYPAGWTISISPKLAFEIVKNEPDRKFFSITAILCLVGAVVFLILLGLDKINVTHKLLPSAVLFLLLMGYMFCQYGKYSDILVNNYVTISEQQFEKITGIKDKDVKYIYDNENKDVEKLFDKPIIK